MGNILFPLGKSEHDSMSGRVILHTDKENEHPPMSFNSYNTFNGPFVFCFVEELKLF